METPTFDQYADRPGYLRWFQDEPYPYRMRNPQASIQQEDFEFATLHQEFHCQTFDLTDEEDLEKYRIVSQRLLDGWYTIIDIQKKWDPDKGGMKIWMEWTQNYMEIPNVSQY